MKYFLKVITLAYFVFQFVISFGIERQGKNLIIRKKQTFSFKENPDINSISTASVAMPFDTIGFKEFWDKFKFNVLHKNIDSIRKSIIFPVHAIYPVILEYAFDCDTTKFILNSEKYNNFKIDSLNFYYYYNFIFGKLLRTMIQKTEVNDILKNGIYYFDQQFIIYIFFPKNYQLNVKCPNDHNLKFYFSKIKGFWKFSIGGL